MSRIKSYFVYFLLCPLGLIAQDVKVLNFGQLEEHLSKNSNKLLVVNFWATWCGPCIKELKHFQRLDQEYREKNLKVILVSIDYPEKLETALKPFLRKNKITAETLLLDEANANKWINRVSEKWEGSIPATLVITQGNKERSFFEREFTYEELQKTIEPYLNR
jgi:thiol-disulfide isomerase/thioredoxin